MINRHPLLAPALFGNLSEMLNNAMDSFSEAVQQHSDHQLYATPSGWALLIDAPGLNKEEIDLKYEDEALHIKSDGAEFDLNKKFTLGNDVDVDNIEAKMENGVLQLTLPKTNNSKNINIQ